MIEQLNGNKETVNYASNTSIRLYNNDEHEDYPVHWHTSLEIIMPTENIYTVYCNNVEYVLQKGDILFISSGVLHQLNAPTSGRRYIILADLTPLNSMREFESLIALLSPIVHITPTNSPKIHDRLQRLISSIAIEYESDALFKDTVIYSKLISIFALIGRNSTFEKTALDTNSSKELEYSKIFLSVCDYINKHFNENITLEQVADLAGFSKYHFSRIFRQYAEISFYQYLNKKRIMHAASLLMEPDISITEISLQCGFSSISAFIRMFKIHKSCTPSDFKKMYATAKHSY
jgi:AraC-like DNA-binding protein